MRVVLHILSVLLALLTVPRGTAGDLMISRAEYDVIPRWKPGPTGIGVYPRADLRKRLPPVGNQGMQNSCVAWAVAYACKGYQEAVDQDWLPDRPEHQFSPAFLFNQLCGGQNVGIDFLRAFDLVIRQGCATLASMPYDDWNLVRMPSETALREAPQFRCLNYLAMDRGDEVRAALAAGHVVILGIETDPVFTGGRISTYTPQLFQAGLAQRNANLPHSHHALCAVGFDDTTRTFLLMNSWGTQWGEAGYCQVSYDLMEKIGPPAAGENRFCFAAFILYDQRQKIQTQVVPAAADLEVAANVSYVGYYQGAPCWNWAVWITGPADKYRAVVSVDWTIPDGRRFNMSNPGNGHALQSWALAAGHGAVQATARLTNGGVIPLSRALDFTLPVPRSRSLVLTYEDHYLGRENGAPAWEWRLWLHGDLADLADLSDVRYTVPRADGTAPEIHGVQETQFAATGRTTLPESAVSAVAEFRDGTQVPLTAYMRMNDKPQENLALDATAKPAFFQDSSVPGQAWTAFLTGPMESLRRVASVSYEARSGSDFLTGEVRESAGTGFPWSQFGRYGVELRAVVRFIDGTTQELLHAIAGPPPPLSSLTPSLPLRKSGTWPWWVAAALLILVVARHLAKRSAAPASAAAPPPATTGSSRLRGTLLTRKEPRPEPPPSPPAPGKSRLRTGPRKPKR